MTVGSFQLPGSGSSQKAPLYRLVDLVPEDGRLSVRSNAMNMYVPGSSAEGTTVSVYVPERIPGFARDLIFAIDQTDLSSPVSAVFEGAEFVSQDGTAPQYEAGRIDAVSLTEITDGVFAVSHVGLKGMS